MTSYDQSSQQQIRAHKEWIGFVQPVGLVVSIPALEKAQCAVNKNIAPTQERLIALVEPDPSRDGAPREPARVGEFRTLAEEVLGWQPQDLREPSDKFTIVLTEYQDQLAPDFIVADPDDPEGALALVMTVPSGTDFDATSESFGGWHASPEARLERLLRETGVPIGLLYDRESIRLVYAPRGESSGHATFRVKDMITVAGRPIFAGFHALLSATRLFDVGDAQRLSTILKESRLYQSEVSTKLAEQVLGALHELLRGFQAAHDASEGRLLGEVLRERPSDVYGGLLTTLLRLVFILYAEDRGLISKDELYSDGYSVGGLFEKLADDDARFPDTMDQRYGAWSRLVTLFRLIHDGVEHGPFHLPPRYGRLFDPDAYPFLEGRPLGVARQLGERVDPPRVSDGVVYRALRQLLILDGDRLSYRTLDVEQIGSVYEAMMGFEVKTVAESSIALRGKRKKGAPPADPVLGLETLLADKPGARLDRLKKEADVELSGKAATAVKEAKTIDALVAALGRRVSPFTPSVLPPGSMVLQPTEERRRSGSHYTPRILTEPIVEKTLRPVLDGLGARPTPEQILGLKVCDPAMGSGAFLVAACRALGTELEKAWQAHRATPEIPPDEDPVLYARRLVAQRCLYGVDKNPFAVDLAKLSLWLVTLAKEHPFTFVDHALRCGDSLVGLSKSQLEAFHWAPEDQLPLLRKEVTERLERAEHLRAEIQGLAGSDDVTKKRALLAEADAELEVLRRAGNLVVEAFFSEEKDKARLARLRELRGEVQAALTRGNRLPDAPEAEKVRPFHWELEFPEVFGRENSGFDAFVGNPPFAGKNGVVAIHACFLDWLKNIHEESHGNADLVAHFFRRAFDLVRKGGTLGLIATNTIAQGDTRSTGLRWILGHGGVIYDATRRYKWPAGAAVIVSVVHLRRGEVPPQTVRLDGRAVPRISAFLFHTGPDEDPAQLAANADKSFQGSIVLGMGFTFDDSKPDEATSIAEMHRLIAEDPRNQERIFPYLGGEELNTSPTHANHRYVINFGDMSEVEARTTPALMGIVERKVRPERMRNNREGYRKYWWHYAEKRVELYRAAQRVKWVFAVARHQPNWCVARVRSFGVFSEATIVIALEQFSAFVLLQGRAHEVWVRFLASSLEDRIRYTPTDCFETFPFPPAWEHSPALESAGLAYYTFRANLMVKNDQGLTTTYNRFHDPDERDPDILRLRELHAAMDRAVLDAYGWTDLQPTCEFLLDYEDEDDAEDDDAPPTKRKKKKPYRYRWPDDVRDEVLARLLALNAERAAEERRLGLEAKLTPAQASDDEDAAADDDDATTARAPAPTIDAVPMKSAAKPRKKSTRAKRAPDPDA